ncbi:hypothetical protein HYS99_01220 [Candidatus Giovannonibacteria bacterium]|nr:hypothetical protein [Candidatus Giovannonibacteria bacterium]
MPKTRILRKVANKKINEKNFKLEMTPKEILLSVLLVVFGWAAGFVWERIVNAPYLALLLLLYAVILGLFLLIVKNKIAFWTFPVISLVAFSLSFPKNRFLFYGVVLGVVVLIGAEDEARKEIERSLKIFVKMVLGKSIKLFFTGVAIVLAFSYYGEIYDKKENLELILPQRVFETTLKFLERPLQEIWPGFRNEATVSEIFSTPERIEYGKQLGAPLPPDKKISEVLYDLSLARIESYAGQYVEYAPIIAAASFFFALKFVSILFYYLSLILIFLIIKALLALGAIKKEFISAEKEILT